MKGIKIVAAICALLLFASAAAEGVETLFTGVIQVSDLTVCPTPEGLCFDGAGNLYIFDTRNNIIFMRDSDGAYARVAGDEILKSGYADDKPEDSRFFECSDGVFVNEDKLVITDRRNNILRALVRGEVYTYSGNSEVGYKEGDRRYANYSLPCGVTAYNSQVLIADTLNHAIRIADGLGNVRLFAGVPEQSGYLDGPVKQALFNEPIGLAVGDRGEIYVCDSGNQRIRVIEDGMVATVAGWGETDETTGYAEGGFEDGAQARFRFPSGICYAGGVLYIADTGNHAVRALYPDMTVSTVAGTGEPGFSDGVAAKFNAPTDVAYFDGYLYIADSLNAAVRRVKVG